MARPRRILDPAKLNLFLEKNHKTEALRLAAERRVSVSRLFVGWLLNDLENEQKRSAVPVDLEHNVEVLDIGCEGPFCPNGNGIERQLDERASNDGGLRSMIQDSSATEDQRPGPNPPCCGAPVNEAGGATGKTYFLGGG